MNLQGRLKEQQKEILEKLAMVEDVIGVIYTVFADSLSEAEHVWRRLAHEEHGHAATVRSLLKYLDEGHIFYDLGRFKGNRLNACIERLQSALQQARTHDLTRRYCIQMALELEEVLLENRFYETVESDAPEFKHLATAMLASIERHRQIILAEVKDASFTSGP